VFNKQIRKRRGIATVVTSAIMMSAVCILGSTGMVWSQTTLSTQQVEMSNVIDDYTNKINESLTFEYVYCNDTPCETIIVIITNNGKIAMNISQINISDKISITSKT
jgi:archaellum component FlaF (FlaF/FlaG flagellin family)